MNIKINDAGHLLIERGGEWRDQHCPFAEKYENVLRRCGDWCPHFGEPGPARDDGIRYFDLCHGTTLCGIITDERGKE